MQHGQDEAHLIQLKRTGHWIKKQTHQLRNHIRGQDFDKALRWFYADILAMCANSESCVNHIHLTAILGGLAKAWAAADVCHATQIQQQAVDDLHRFAAKILVMLQPVCKALSAREASNLLSSLSMLSIDPSRLEPARMVPATVDAIAQQLMDNINHANVQDLADVLAGHSALQLTPCCEDLMRAVSRQLAVADLSDVWPSRMATILHSLATIPSAAPSIKTLDALCERFGVLLRSHQAADLPTAQSIAGFMWALRKMKYAPSQELAFSLMGRMVALCCPPEKKPMPAQISSVLLACAQLRLPVAQTDIETLVSMLLNYNQHLVDEQTYTNIAWSLALIGCLHNQLFDTFLDQLSLPSIGHAEVLMPSPSRKAKLHQLYQALTWLQPSPSASAHQHEAWSSLQGKLHKLGPKPTYIFKHHSGDNGKLCSALNQLQLSFRAKVVIQSYGADAVLESQGNEAQPIILTLGRPDCITNIPGR